MTLETLRGILLLVIGFGFVVFWHELGHFLAAKWAGVKVEQFAVGFGQALIAWRKGLGMRVGTTTPEFKKKLEAHLESKAGARQIEELRLKERVDSGWSDLEWAQAAQEIGISETEYRLNWIPLGGYVKMLGQDDLKPNAEAEDPRAFNRQSVGKRMVIVSAGVVMNVILAAFGFIMLFLIGFHVPPSKIGSVMPGSPGQLAKIVEAPAGFNLPPGLQVGDRILSVNGKEASNDWTKIQLNVALADPTDPMQVVVERMIDGKPVLITLELTPQTGSGATKKILSLGIGAAYELRSPALKTAEEKAEYADPVRMAKTYMQDAREIKPGDVVTAINSQPVQPGDYVAFDRALQTGDGQVIQLTVTNKDGKVESRFVQPRFLDPFGDQPLNFAGLLPRVQISTISDKAPSFGWIMPGDIVEAASTGKEQNTVEHPSAEKFRDRMKNAAFPVQLDLLREDGQRLVAMNLATMTIEPGKQGLGVGIGHDDLHAVVADLVPDSAAAKAAIAPGSTITTIAGKPVTTWFDVRREMLSWLKSHPAGTPTSAAVPINYTTEKGVAATTGLEISAAEAKALEGFRLKADLAFDQSSDIRKAPNAWIACKWGVTETRDFILQFYLTLRRMVTGGVPADQAMGPLGIFQAGKTFANRGNDWLIWFLSMISANLAVVNFLPIPIVDGGLFTFLILEKIKGKPLSARTQAIAQYVGLALLVGVFLFVTYQDITWFPFRGR